MGGSNTVCAETTEKRIESQLKSIKLHRIIIKVYKIICFTHTKFHQLSFFFDPRQNFMDPRDPHDLCQSLTHATHGLTRQHYQRYDTI